MVVQTARVVSVGVTGHSNGAGFESVSPMSTTCSDMTASKRYSSGSHSQYSDVFGDDSDGDVGGGDVGAGDGPESQSGSKSNGRLAPPQSDNRGRLSPIQQIMTYRTPSPVDSTMSRSSRRSKDVGASDYGRFYKQSYIKDDSSFKKGPSQNPTDPSKSHFHRPPNFSYMNVRRDFNQPMKKGLLSSLGGARTVLGKTNKELQPVMKNKEAIALSKFPRGQYVEDAPAPIERDDWPAPPAPAAAYPELLRAHNLGYRGKENHSPSEANGDSVDGEEKPASVDPKVQRELDELRKVKSGVGDVLLKHLEQKSKAQPHLDPRSASRTPAADREPMYKTRYQNPIFASPSRDTEFRTRLYSLDDQLLGTKYRTTPFANSPVPKPGYGLKVSNAPSRRTEGYVSEGYLTDEERPYRNYLAIIAPDSYERRSEHSVEHSADLDRSQRSTEYDRSSSRNNNDGSNIGERRSYYTSQSSFEDSMYDPETGLRRSRYRGSQIGSDHLSGSYLGYKRSIPNISHRGEEPPLIYPYEQLRITNPTLPHGTDTNTLERHLSKDEFESIFHMSHEEFYRLAEWKRNDMKKRVQLY